MFSEFLNNGLVGPSVSSQSDGDKKKQQKGKVEPRSGLSAKLATLKVFPPTCGSVVGSENESAIVVFIVGAALQQGTRGRLRTV